MKTLHHEEENLEKSTNSTRKCLKLDISNLTMHHKVAASILISALVVFSLWGFWEKGFYALGINTTITLLIFFGSLLIFSEKKLGPKELIWIFPLLLLIGSYSLFDNPFIKHANYFIVPISLALCYTYFLLESKNKTLTPMFLIALVEKIFSFLLTLNESLQKYFGFLTPKNIQKKHHLKSVLIGCGIFVLFAFLIVLPLLSSVDSVFADQVNDILLEFADVLSTQTIAKIFVFLLWSVFLLAIFLAWPKKRVLLFKESQPRKLNSIVVGIFLLGTLILYLLFLALQIKRLFVGELPFDFRTTETLVKSGFWQLVMLTIINAGIFLAFFCRSSRFTQHVLFAFSGSSLLLIFSAAQRVFLYIKYYGLSYEKFFAFYTVVFAILFFVLLLTSFFLRKKFDLPKIGFILFLWMYAVTTVLPLESMMIKTNIKLAKIPESRIIKYEMTMFSPDAYVTIKSLLPEAENTLYDVADSSLNESETVKERRNFSEKTVSITWSDWIAQQERIVREKKWYERNLFNWRF